MWNSLKWTLTGLVILLSVALAGLVGYAVGGDDADNDSVAVPGQGDDDGGDTAQFGILDEIEGVLQDDFINPGALTPDALETGAIDGIIASLGDAHTVYIPPTDYQSGVDIISRSFEGIGAHVDQDPTTGEITIVSPIRGSPAEKAGIVPGDVILEVDGESTEGWSVQDAVSRIRGPEGSEVVITVRHPDRQEETYTLNRTTIDLPTVFAQDARDADGNIVPDLAYIELQYFAESSVNDLRTELERITSEGYEGLILDLRRNPGGALDATVAIADMFLDGGNVLTQVDRDGGEIVYDAEPGGEATEIPIVILVSNGSASGSEVLSGALRDHGRARLVGTQTFGKGSVNHIHELSNGGALYVTFARWLTPNGTLIEGVGLAPDETVELDPEELNNELINGYGPQMTAAIDMLQAEIAASQ